MNLPQPELDKCWFSKAHYLCTRLKKAFNSVDRLSNSVITGGSEDKISLCQFFGDHVKILAIQFSYEWFIYKKKGKNTPKGNTTCIEILCSRKFWGFDKTRTSKMNQ